MGLRLDGFVAVSMSANAAVIEVRFFGGFSAEETAQALGVSVATVQREQRLAEARLGKKIFREPGAVVRKNTVRAPATSSKGLPDAVSGWQFVQVVTGRNTFTSASRQAND